MLFGTPHLQDTQAQPGVLPLPPLALALQARLGGTQMSLLARGWPSLTLEQNTGQLEAWVPCLLSPQHGLPDFCWAAKFSAAHRTRVRVDPGRQFSLTWSQAWVLWPWACFLGRGGRRGKHQGHCLAKECHQPPGLISVSRDLGMNPRPLETTIPSQPTPSPSRTERWERHPENGPEVGRETSDPPTQQYRWLCQPS